MNEEMHNRNCLRYGWLRDRCTTEELFEFLEIAWRNQNNPRKGEVLDDLIDVKAGLAIDLENRAMVVKADPQHAAGIERFTV